MDENIDYEIIVKVSCNEKKLKELKDFIYKNLSEKFSKDSSDGKDDYSINGIESIEEDDKPILCTSDCHSYNIN